MVQCSQESCIRPAMAQVKGKGGIVMVCRSHYDEYHKLVALRSCRDMGLDTAAKCKAYVNTYIRPVISSLAA